MYYDKRTFKISFPDQPERPPIYLKHGRDLWALQELLRAGAKGVTSYDNPAPRLGGYIHNLRGHGILIDTELEPHGGEYAGRHARYRLACVVTVEAI